jgi:hypothetical protein
METDSNAYTDAHGRPEIVADPQFATESAVLVRATSTSGDDDRADSDVRTEPDVADRGGEQTAGSGE